MTAQEAYVLIEQLKGIFDVVRLVNAPDTEVCRISSDGKLVREPLRCYEVWKKERRCVNCVSARVCPAHNRIEKYEFVNGEIYHITSKLVDIDGETFALEIVSRTSDNTLFEAFGKESFIHTIEDMNQKMYVDPVTGIYNRRYYEEQVKNWKSVTAMAVVDIDDFKRVNDCYGHLVGDDALKAVATVLKGQVRSQDAVLRFGGDEFLMVYTGITKDAFAKRLEKARDMVTDIKLDSCSELKLSVSIGGTYASEVHEGMFKIADTELYKAKTTKNCVIIP